MAGIAGTAISQLLLLDLPALHPVTWGVVAITFMLILGFATAIEYWIQSALDPDIELPRERVRRR